MLKIHKPFSKKLCVIGITSILGVGALLGLNSLIYIPELSHAETIDTRNTLDDIKYMQDITPAICRNSELEKQRQLIDKRDNKVYWVAKLKDGNCWMTQNLALELWDNESNTGIKLTSLDSDVKDEWVSTTGESTLTGNASKYYSAGEFIYTNPQEVTDCSSSNGISGCSRTGWVEVSGLKASTDPDFDSLLNDTEYNAHYLSGNYYSWYAATAGSGNGTSIESVAPDSICPKSWRLPLSGVNCSGSSSGPCTNNETSGSYYNLFNYYGLTELASNSETGVDVRGKPFYITYYGYTGYTSGQYPYMTYDIRVGYGGSLLTSAKSGSNSSIYRMSLSENGYSINPSSSAMTDRGYSVRCVARMEDSGSNVEIAVNPTISLDVMDEVNIAKSETNPSTADLGVRVSSNQPYSVNINAKDHTELVSENDDNIPSNGGTLTAAENNWGIQKPNESTYTKVTTSPQLFYQSTNPESKNILFKIGISTSPNLPSGTYTTDLTITATQN